MPQAVNLTLKDAAGTDRLFELLAPAAGDGSYANWRYKDGNVPISWKAVAIKTTANADQTARKVNIILKVPSTYTDPSSGLPTVAGVWDLNLTVTVPNMVGVDRRPDAAAFAKNLLAHAMVQEILKDAFPAT